MKSFREFEQLDEAGVRAEVVATMKRQLNDPATDSRLALMALRFLEGRPVGTLQTRATQEEIDTLLRHREAALAARLH